MSRLAEIYKQEKKSGGGLGSAMTKRMGEKIDPRQMLDASGVIATMFPGLKPYSATKQKTPSATSSMPSISSGSGELSLISEATKITAKNTLAMPAMARDMYLMKQNMVKLVKLQGGKPQTKSGDFFSRQQARESAFEQQMASMGRKSGSVGASGGIEQKDGGSFLDKIGAIFGFPMFGKKAPVPPTPQPKGQYRDPKTGRFAKRPPPATAASRLGSLSTTLARALPFLSSALLPVLGIAGLAGLLVYLIKNDKGKGLSSDDIDKDNLDFTPDQQITASSFNTPGTDDEIRKARENMRASDNPDERAAAAKLDVTNPLPTISPSPQPVITQPQPNVSPVPSNVVTSGSGAPVMTGSGLPLTSGDGTPFTTVSPSPAAPATSTTPTKSTTPSGSGPSDGLINFLKQKENPALAKSKGTSKAFWDYKQYSIGYGTKASGPDEMITEAEADKRLRDEISKSYQYVASYAKQKGYNWDQGKMDALASFVYNLGPGQLKNLTNDGKRTDAEIAQALPLYNKAGGKVLAGLEVRRTAELGMFTGGGGAPGGGGGAVMAASSPTGTAPSSGGGGGGATLAAAAPPSTGSTVASASSSVADGRQSGGGGGNVVVDNSQRTTVASSQPSGKPTSAYDRDIVSVLVSGIAA